MNTYNESHSTGHLRLRELFRRTCSSHTCSTGSGSILSLPHLWLFFLTSSAKFLTSCNPLKTYFEKLYALPQPSATRKSYAHWDCKPLHCLLLKAESSFLWLLLTMVKRDNGLTSLIGWSERLTISLCLFAVVTRLWEPLCLSLLLWFSAHLSLC